MFQPGFLEGAHFALPRRRIMEIGTHLNQGLAAVMVGGQESVKWFGQPELVDYRVFAVNRHEESSWEI